MGHRIRTTTKWLTDWVGPVGPKDAKRERERERESEMCKWQRQLLPISVCSVHPLVILGFLIWFRITQPFFHVLRERGRERCWVCLFCSDLSSSSFLSLSTHTTYTGRVFQYSIECTSCFSSFLSSLLPFHPLSCDVHPHPLSLAFSLSLALSRPQWNSDPKKNSNLPSPLWGIHSFRQQHKVPFSLSSSLSLSLSLFLSHSVLKLTVFYFCLFFPSNVIFHPTHN